MYRCREPRAESVLPLVSSSELPLSSAASTKAAQIRMYWQEAVVLKLNFCLSSWALPRGSQWCSWQRSVKQLVSIIQRSIHVFY